jgi:hypothetical protein
MFLSWSEASPLSTRVIITEISVLIDYGVSNVMTTEMNFTVKGKVIFFDFFSKVIDR